MDFSEYRKLSGALLAGASIFVFGVFGAHAQSVNIATPEQALAESLKDIAHQTGENILFTPDAVAGVSAHALSGSMTAQQAVDALLAGTKLEAVSDGNGGLIVRQKQTAVPQQKTELQGATPIETIVVSARRREEQIGDVPIAAAVITADQLSQRGLVTDTGDILANVPGVHYDNQASSRFGDISIRGSRTGGTNADGAVGLYRDGVYVGTGYQFDRNFSYLDSFDLSQVVVLRGTQGALYGRNAEGGVVEEISAKPEFEDSGHVNIDYGINNEAPDIQGVLNEQINDNIAVRLGADVRQQLTGLVYDSAVDKYVDAGHALVLRGQARYENGRLDVDLLVEHQTDDGFAANNQLHFLAGTPGYPAGLGGYTQPRYDYDVNTFPAADADVNDVFLTANYKLDFGTLTSVSAIRGRDGYDLTDVDGFSPASLTACHATGNCTNVTDPNQTVIQRDHTQTLYEDLYLAGDKISGITWLAGLELLDVHANNYQDITKSLSNPSDSIVTVNYAYSSFAPYATLSYDILDNLTIEAEGRYTHDNKDIYQNKYTISSGVSTTTINYPFEAPLQANSLVYTLTLDYHLFPDLMFYAKTGTGFREGGFNTPSVSVTPANDPTPVLPAYGNENTLNWELGAKGNPLAFFYPNQQWFSMDIALYRNVLGNVDIVESNGCVAGVAPCFGPPTSFLVNGGKADEWGLELGADANFSLLGGDTTLQLSGSTQSGRLLEGSVKGLLVPLMPHWLGAVNLNYSHPFYYSSIVFINVNFNTQSGGINDTTSKFLIPSAQTGNVRIGVDYGKWEAALYAKDISNAVYPLWGPTATATATRWSEPRIWGMELRYHW